MTLKKIYSRFDRPVSQALTTGDSMTHQSFKDECDINNLVARYQRTGSWSDGMTIPSVQPSFGTFDQNFTYYEAQNLIKRAENEFMSLPASVRSRFDNDPGKLLSFVDDPANAEEAAKLGLIDSFSDQVGQVIPTPTSPSIKGDGGNLNDVQTS